MDLAFPCPFQVGDWILLDATMTLVLAVAPSPEEALEAMLSGSSGPSEVAWAVSSASETTSARSSESVRVGLEPELCVELPLKRREVSLRERGPSLDESGSNGCGDESAEEEDDVGLGLSLDVAELAVPGSREPPRSWSSSWDMHPRKRYHERETSATPEQAGDSERPVLVGPLLGPGLWLF